MSCGVSRRLGSDLAWLWLWRRTAAVALIRPPQAWEPPYAAGVALKSKKKKKKRVLVSCVHCFNLNFSADKSDDNFFHVFLITHLSGIVHGQNSFFSSGILDNFLLIIS